MWTPAPAPGHENLGGTMIAILAAVTSIPRIAVVLLLGSAVLLPMLAGCEHRPQSVDQPLDPTTTPGPRGGGNGSGTVGQPPAMPSSGGGASPDAGAAPSLPGTGSPPGAGGQGGTGSVGSPSCITEIAGDETTCKSLGEWKSIAAEACQAKGEALLQYSLGGGDCGNGNTNQVKYECCPLAPPLPPAPPPTPTVPSCFGNSEGSDASCKAPEVWKKYATDYCNAQGANLKGIAYSDDCGGGAFRYTKYACCPPAAPPAQPFDPCAGKLCGESCRLCPPDDKGCTETADLKTCNFVGQCSSEPSMCSSGASSCPAGQTWCYFSGHCVDAHCRTCCDSTAAPGCLMPADCGPSCTTCSDGTQSCAPANCGLRSIGQCFFQEPKCGK
jgi:hypothetical protein